MVKCNCGREFEKETSLNSHARFCDKYIKKKKTKSKYKINDNLYKCECEKEFDNYQSLNGHFSHCLEHKEKTNSKLKKTYNTPKGKMQGWDKFTDEDKKRIAKKSGQTSSRKIKNGQLIPPFNGKKHKTSSLDKISEARVKYLDKTKGWCEWFNIFNGEEYIKVQGTWEKKIAYYLTNNNILWKRGLLKYLEVKRYIPDFYLPEYDMYIEVKGWWKNSDIIKMNNIHKEYPNIDLKIIDISNMEDLLQNKINIFDLINLKQKVNLWKNENKI